MCVCYGEVSGATITSFSVEEIYYMVYCGEGEGMAQVLENALMSAVIYEMRNGLKWGKRSICKRWFLHSLPNFANERGLRKTWLTYLIEEQQTGKWQKRNMLIRMFIYLTNHYNYELSRIHPFPISCFGSVFLKSFHRILSPISRNVKFRFKLYANSPTQIFTEILSLSIVRFALNDKPSNDKQFKNKKM